MPSKSSIKGDSNSFRLSWATILDEYKQALETAGKSPKTINGYRESLSDYFAFHETWSIAQPTPETGIKGLREYIAYLQHRERWPNNPHIKEENRGRLSPFTVQARVRDIKTFWSWMHKEGYIDRNPLADLPIPEVPENLIKIITPEQFRYLLSNVDISTPDGSKYHCILLILYDNGMRISELVMIRISDVDFEAKTIKIMGKGRIERLVPITVYSRRHIMKYNDRSRPKLCPENCPYLFANQDGEPILKNSVQQFMRRLLVKSGLKEVKFSPHILRHSFATQFLANGGNVFHLKAILGHKSLTTTLRYTNLQVQDIQKQHAKFSPVAQLFRNKS